MHKESELNQNYNNNTLYSMNQDVYDIRLKENFKLFISGPSRCGKTVFVSNLLERINECAKVPPTKVIYIYKVWQSKYDEMLSLGVNFKEDHNNIVNDIKSSVSGEPTLIIFDDLIGSSSLKEIANLFTVDARHMNMSLVFLTQRMFVNDEGFRQISQNCDYFVIFKNPRNSSEIRALAQQMTPGNLILVNIYLEATKWPFSYLFINLTQECNPSVKYLSNLFNGIQAYIPIGKTFRKIGGYGNFKSMLFGGNVSQKPLESFKPPQNFTMVNETFTHNTQTNPTPHPMKYSNNQNQPTPRSMNYINTQTNPTPHLMNYNFNQQHQYDVAKQNPSNYTQTNINPMIYKNNRNIQPSNYTHTDINPMNYNFNQQHQYDVAIKIH